MQNYYKTIGALVVASALAAGNASAEIESDIHVGFTDQYLFRGLDLGNNLVESGLDFATEYNGLDVSAGLWYASFDEAGVDYSELDLYGGVAKEFSFATLEVGVIHYVVDRAFGVDSTELYLSASREIFGLDTSLTYFWDVYNDNDGYAELAAGKSFELSSCLTLNTGATLAYLVEQGQLAHLTAKVSLDYAYNDTTTISPFIAHAWSLNDDVNTAYVGTGNELVGGAILSVSF